MVDSDVIAYLRYGHGLYNTTVMLLFFAQGWTGMTIRRHRLRGEAVPLASQKRHRIAGPVLAVLGALGFFAGLALVVVDTGTILEYPLHLFVGSAIILLIVTTYVVSRHITGPDGHVRTLHFRLGIIILVLYPIEGFLGIGILL